MIIVAVWKVHEQLTCFFTSAQVIFSDLSPTNLIGPRFALTVSPPLPILIVVYCPIKPDEITPGAIELR